MRSNRDQTRRSPEDAVVESVHGLHCISVYCLRKGRGVRRSVLKFYHVLGEKLVPAEVSERCLRLDSRLRSVMTAASFDMSHRFISREYFWCMLPTSYQGTNILNRLRLRHRVFCCQSSKWGSCILSGSYSGIVSESRCHYHDNKLR